MTLSWRCFSRWTFTTSHPSKPNSLGLIHLTEDGAVHEMCLEECLETLTSSGLLSLRSVNPVSFPSVLLMLQKSGVHQLRLVVYPIIHKVFYIPGGCLGFLNHQRCMSPKGWGYSTVWYGLGWSPGKSHQQDQDIFGIWDLYWILLPAANWECSVKNSCCKIRVVVIFCWHYLCGVIKWLRPRWWFLSLNGKGEGGFVGKFDEASLSGQNKGWEGPLWKRGSRAPRRGNERWLSVVFSDGILKDFFFTHTYVHCLFWLFWREIFP